MLIDILTLFPELFSSVFSASIIRRAQDQKKITFRLINIRDFGIGTHKQVDDKPYGGGVGMILRVDVLNEAISFARDKSKQNYRIILLDPKGKSFTQNEATRLSHYDHLILVCGHYEGVDHRVNKLVDETVSIGPYVLTGGEIPAMVLVETIVRLLPGVLIKPKAVKEESFAQNSLEHPQYTRPRKFKNWQVPKVLLTGNHQEIIKWRKSREKSLDASETRKRISLPDG